MKEDMLKKIKMRLLPPSSRSFHSGVSEIKMGLEKLQKENEQLHREIEELKGMQKFHEINANLYNDIQSTKDELMYKLNVMNKHMQLYAEGLYRKDEESVKDTRIRFFSQLPDAVGYMRLHQLVNAKLMNALDEICKKNNLEYWFGYASLLGAYTRGGAIPWDDDIDICMLRSDLEKLIDILKGNEKYEVTVVYDYYVKVKQYRFCTKDKNVLSFIDIGVWDWAIDISEKKEKRFQQMRAELMEELESEKGKYPYWGERKYLFAPGSGFVVQYEAVDLALQNKEKTLESCNEIDKIFNKYQKKAYDEEILCDEAQATALAYGLDNILDTPGRRMLWTKQMIFPTQKEKYEGFMVKVPANVMEFLDNCYKEWPYLPQDILGGHEHFEKRQLQEEAVQEAMRRYLAE